ncbi:MAG: YCF48-related protein [Ignavibacteriota bacterium]
MSFRFDRPIFGLWLLALAASPLAAQKWQIQYFYDHSKSNFEICDLRFPSATRGVAVGVITTGKHESPMSVVTADGGAHWQSVPLKETPLSLFFLNENLGWMVTGKGLWQTVEAGRSWTKMPKLPAEIYRVHFVDENHGWAIGPKKTALETTDGGKTWKPLGLRQRKRRKTPGTQPTPGLPSLTPGRA